MRIGLLITSIGDFGEKGFYNVQEIGLAKELAKLFDEIHIYKLVDKNEMIEKWEIENYQNICINLIPSRRLGSNGIVNLERLDKTLDAIVYFSDTQVEVPKVYKWCKNNSVQFIPYIGVASSHSDNKLKKIIINLLFRRNLKVYRENTCIVKNSLVEYSLREKGVPKCILAPVGLDTEIMNKNYFSTSIESLKRRWGYTLDEKVILFVGRLVPEKKPLEMLDIFQHLFSLNMHYRLIIVGMGELEEHIKGEISYRNLSPIVKILHRIPNSEMWELYRISETFVNLSSKEIFGMAILEAMYYECKVVAWKAPGPCLIIENGKSGYVVDSLEDLLDKILIENDVGIQAHERIITDFTWGKTANKIRNLLVYK